MSYVSDIINAGALTFVIEMYCTTYEVKSHDKDTPVPEKFNNESSKLQNGQLISIGA